MRRLQLVFATMAAAVIVFTTGCAKRGLVEEKDQTIADLTADIERLQNEKALLEEEITTQESVNDELEHSLAGLRDREEVWMQQKKDMTHISLEGEATFATARAELTEDARHVLDRVAGVLQEYPERWVLVEGHADERPIADGFEWKYESNWELSAARANSVVHYLIEKHDLDPARVKSIGLGEYHPADDRSSPEAWSKNRRVVITVGSKLNVQKQMALHRR
jgi:chemotaxis protein MotB